MPPTRLVLGLTLAAVTATATAAACGSSAPAPAPLRNTAGDSPAGARITVDAATPLGALGLGAAQLRDDELPYWVPITAVAPVVAPLEAELVAGTSYTVVPSDGATAVTMRAGASAAVKYGCDDNATDLIPLDGPVVAPGLVWILPPSAPATWAPLAEPLTAVETTRDRRHWTAGTLALTLARTGDSHATFTIRDNGAAAHHERAERHLMDGADASPIDLAAQRWPGIPTPAAVFRLAAGGPYLVVLDRSGYEGVTFETLLVGAGDVRTVESLRLSLYYCAF